jgi:Flp pilus assembly protein TadD
MLWGRLAIFVAFSIGLAGCAKQEFLTTGALVHAEDEAPPSNHRPSDEGVAEGQRYYHNAHYGLAERTFRKAVLSNPKSVDAWMGLAASYDRLGRFDLAQRAYERVWALGGSTATYHNNLGYHHLLRGNKAMARRHIRRAAQIDPSNPSILGNMELLETWKSGDEDAIMAQKELLNGKRLKKYQKTAATR